ncbi:16S rRNA (cytosine(967)-C(5))-methyltransferase RsmB [Salinithrix halophila]|uniref:16S rRNA (cytosine(967)-C(5))-methyltransferase n=1 Tax=Salinithrix halophila TaxID=1485204 RepID=A0ABV8JDB6_9BACL
MNNKRTARDIALDILIAADERGAYSNLLLNDALEKSRLTDPRDRGLVTELVYGTIQRRNTLDWIIDSLVRKGGHSLDPWVHQLLRMGLYQLRFLDKIPSRAAVHETVGQAKSRGHKGISGLVNGVLRSYLRRVREWELPAEPDNSRTLALAYSHPEWMVRRMMEAYGQETAVQVMAANNRPPAITLRTNPMKTDRETLIDRLKEAYPQAEVAPSSISEQGIVFSGGGNLAFHPLYREGWYSVQDESSMLVAEVLDPQPGNRGLDGCAAPGGKTAHLAERMKNQGSLLASDIHEHKVGLIETNAARLGLSIIKVCRADLRELPDEAAGSFDFVLLDAPCSGLGVIRRKPDIKWSKTPQEVDSLVRLQRELLEAAAKLVLPGGTLVYSTCTMEPRENEEQVADFLARYPEFCPDPAYLNKLPGTVREQAILGDGSLQILPHQFNSDGFFIARLLRQEG